MPGHRHALMGAAQQQSQPSPPIVAQRLCDLLLSFPSAAVGGVQWQVLVRRYEERHSTRLDLAALGHSSPLAAASALLFDVLRLVDREDTDNPVVGVMDAVALEPQPGLLGTWPSLYAVMCGLVLSNGSLKAADETCSERGGADTRCLLLSQLRPLLERHWHANFDESALGFLNEEGSFLRLKKMKHLLHAVLRWRQQRQAWQTTQQLKPGAVDEALLPNLEVVASSKHNDLLLICSRGSAVAATSAAAPSGAPQARAPQATSAAYKERITGAVPEASCHSGRAEAGSLQRELERLRAENDTLRTRNQMLEHRGGLQTTDPEAPCDAAALLAPLPPRIEADIFDDPFEPPPEAQPWRPGMPVLPRKFSLDLAATDAGSEISFEMSSTASYASGPTSSVPSGAATPVHAAPMAQQACTFFPMWFPVIQSQGPWAEGPWSVIPRGIVKTAVDHIERISGS